MAQTLGILKHNSVYSSSVVLKVHRRDIFGSAGSGVLVVQPEGTDRQGKITGMKGRENEYHGY